MFETTPALCWLHPVHVESRQKSSEGISVAPWEQSEDDVKLNENRKDALGKLLHRAATGQLLSLAEPGSESSTGGRNLFLLQKPENHSLRLSRGRIVITEGPWKGPKTPVAMKIPLLLSDLFHATVLTGMQEKENVANYIIAIAPRPEPPVPKDPAKGVAAEELEDVKKQAMPPLGPVWLLCVGSCSSMELQRALFELGGHGALRWDLQQCYDVTTRALGTGGCGTVYLGQNRSNVKQKREEYGKLDALTIPQVAVKILKKSSVPEEVSIRSEIHFLARSRGHPNLSALFGVFCHWEEVKEDQEDDQATPGPGRARLRWSIVMELCTGGDLFDFLSANGAMNEAEAVELMIGLLSALAHLHSMRIVHRDVKSENILLASNRPVLADLGIAADLDDHIAMQRRVGSLGYAAPEVVTDQPYDEKVDVFGAGVVLYLVLSNRLPFQGKSLSKVLNLTARCRVKFDPTIFGELSGSIVQLLRALLCKDPRQRPTARRSFSALWMLAGPEVRGTATAKAAYVAFSDDGKEVHRNDTSGTRATQKSNSKDPPRPAPLSADEPSVEGSRAAQKEQVPSQPPGGERAAAEQEEVPSRPQKSSAPQKQMATPLGAEGGAEMPGPECIDSVRAPAAAADRPEESSSKPQEAADANGQGLQLQPTAPAGPKPNRFFRFMGRLPRPFSKTRVAPQTGSQPQPAAAQDQFSNVVTPAPSAEARASGAAPNVAVQPPRSRPESRPPRRGMASQ